MPGISCGGSGGRYLKGASGGTPVSAARWSVPIDDTHTLLMAREVQARGQPRQVRRRSVSAPLEAPGEFHRAVQGVSDSDNPVLGYDIPPLHFIEDGMVVDSLGPRVDREKENLSSTIDDGIIRLRSMYLREMENLRLGRDPKNVIRDPEKNRTVVITAYERWVSEAEREELEGSAPS